jgi:hypothetical protein
VISIASIDTDYRAFRKPFLGTKLQIHDALSRQWLHQLGRASQLADGTCHACSLVVWGGEAIVQG